MSTIPDFSITLNRESPSQHNSTYDPNLGYLAFGGIVPVPTTFPTVTVPVQVLKSSYAKGSKAYTFYAVDVEAYTFSGSMKRTNSTTMAAILDSGTTLNSFPSDVAKAYNSRFIPPAYKDDGLYFVACNATAPDFEVQIGGKKFKVDPKDQIVATGTTNTTTGEAVCLSGTQSNRDFHDLSTLCVQYVYIPLQ